MKVPRDVSGAHLADILCRRWQYARVHQVGSHIILETSVPIRHRIAISSILRAVAGHKGPARDDHRGPIANPRSEAIRSGYLH